MDWLVWRRRNHRPTRPRLDIDCSLPKLISRNYLLTTSLHHWQRTFCGTDSIILRVIYQLTFMSLTTIWKSPARAEQSRSNVCITSIVWTIDCSPSTRSLLYHKGTHYLHSKHLNPLGTPKVHGDLPEPPKENLFTSVYTISFTATQRTNKWPSTINHYSATDWLDPRAAARTTSAAPLPDEQAGQGKRLYQAIHCLHKQL